MNAPTDQVSEEAMLAQLVADFTAGLSSARLEHALARLARKREGKSEPATLRTEVAASPGPNRTRSI